MLPFLCELIKSLYVLCKYVRIDENVADIRTLENSLNSCALGEGCIL